MPPQPVGETQLSDPAVPVRTAMPSRELIGAGGDQRHRRVQIAGAMTVWLGERAQDMHGDAMRDVFGIDLEGVVAILVILQGIARHHETGDGAGGDHGFDRRAERSRRHPAPGWRRAGRSGDREHDGESR